jgi:hypothetical protein
MHKAKWCAAWLLMCVVISSIAAVKIEDWKLGENKEGIQVYTRKSEFGKIRTSKAEMFIAVPAAKVVEALMDFNNYSKWFPSCIGAAILTRVSDNEFMSQLKYKTPWPFPNMDCVERMIIDRRPGGDTTFIRVKAEPKYIGPTGNLVRIREMEDTWQIVSVRGGTQVTNVYYADLGNFVPYFIANTQAVDIPYNIFHNMRDFISSGQKK